MTHSELEPADLARFAVVAVDYCCALEAFDHPRIVYSQDNNYINSKYS